MLLFDYDRPHDVAVLARCIRAIDPDQFLSRCPTIMVAGLMRTDQQFHDAVDYGVSCNMDPGTAWAYVNGLMLGALFEGMQEEFANWVQFGIDQTDPRSAGGLNSTETTALVEILGDLLEAQYDAACHIERLSSAQADSRHANPCAELDLPDDLRCPQRIEREERIQREDTLDWRVVWPMSSPSPNYHHLFVTTRSIERTRFSELSFRYKVTCTRVGGWELWEGDKLVAGEFDTISAPLRLDVNGVVICDGLRTETDVKNN